MKLSKKEILNNYEKYKHRLLSIGCMEITTEDLFYISFKDDAIFIVEKKLEDFLSPEEIKCFEELKKIIKKSNEEDKKIIVNMLLNKGE